METNIALQTAAKKAQGFCKNSIYSRKKSSFRQK